MPAVTTAGGGEALQRTIELAIAMIDGANPLKTFFGGHALKTSMMLLLIF